MQVGQLFENYRNPFSPYICAAFFLGGCAMAHPWYLVGMRIQYNRFQPPFESGIMHKEAYRNTLKAILYIKET